MHAIQFTLKSSNVKVGPLPVSTTSSESCPTSCPLINAGCYAKAGNVAMLWRALSAATAGETYKRGNQTLQSLTWRGFCDAVAKLAPDTLWRHNQAGDLPGQGDAIDVEALSALVAANSNKRGFTYTHKPIDAHNNAQAIKAANAAGFTINLSANNMRDADRLAAANIGPVVVVLPADVSGNVKLATPEGRTVSVCPATYRDDVSCKSCGLCQRQNRKTIVGFPAHGASRRKASAVAMS